MDTAALQSMLNASSYVRIPAGSYTTDAALTVDRDDVSVEADGAVINYVGPAGPALKLGGANTRQRLRVAGLRLIGGGIRAENCFYSFLERCYVEQPVIGIDLYSCTEMHVARCDVRNHTTAGIQIDSAVTAQHPDGRGNDQYLSDCRIVGNPASQPPAGVRIKATHGLWMENIGTIFCATGFEIKPVPPLVVEFLFTSRCSADQGNSHGWAVGGAGGAVRSWHSVNDWAASNRDNGVLVSEGAQIQFSGMRCVNNHDHGMQLIGSDFVVEGCLFSGNGGQGIPGYNGPFSWHGLVLGNVQGARLIGNRSGQVAHFGNLHGYGLYMAGAGATNVLIQSNDFRNNRTGDKALAGGYLLGINYP